MLLSLHEKSGVLCLQGNDDPSWREFMHQRVMKLACQALLRLKPPC